MQKKGQGALEYLLLIGGAVLIAVIIIAVVTGMANTTGNAVSNSAICATQQGCDACKKTATGLCAGVSSTGTVTFRSGGSAAAVCTTAEVTGFSYCKPA